MHQRSRVVKGSGTKRESAVDSSSWYSRAKSGGKKTALILLRPSPGPLPENGVLCLTLNLTVTSGRTLRCIKGRRFFSGRGVSGRRKSSFSKCAVCKVARAKESKSLHPFDYLFSRLKIDYRENEYVFISGYIFSRDLTISRGVKVKILLRLFHRNNVTFIFIFLPFFLILAQMGSEGDSLSEIYN